MSTTAPGRILIVDDDEGVIDVLREIVEDGGYEVETVETAVAALAVVRERRPDAVLLDLYMPGVITGDAAVSTLASYAPVIVITSSTDTDLGQKMLASGAFSYLTKPVQLTELMTTIEAAVAQRRRTSLALCLICTQPLAEDADRINRRDGALHVECDPRADRRRRG